MASVLWVMSCVKLQSPHTSLVQKAENNNPRLIQEKRDVELRLRGYGKSSTICCGMRGGPRKPMWRSRVLSREAINGVQSLKLANSPSSASKIEEAFSSRLSRLLKADLIDVLEELQRQNEWELAHKVFEFIRKEVWYKPDLSLYCDMIFMFGKNKMIGTTEELFFQLKSEGLEPDTRTYTEMIGAYLKVGMVEKAMDTYRSLKESGCIPEKLTLTILIRNLEKAGEDELASTVKKDCLEYVDFPKKFLQEVGREYPKKRSLKLV